ncbi:MAG: SDR family NAD(P)-dependent oxidoreductase [Bacteroidales bacterium]|nr:SDR family NAD(P)-dependent oxidoreductase [Bacteroidales bacterium]MDT8431322.1 SDR family NAD(P)-dependent oxidoreductase [Bacteroidales bacterium]
MKKIALITGATSGIGRATARILAAHAHDVIITGRRAALLEETGQLIREKTGADVLPLSFDVRDIEQVQAHLGNLRGKWEKVDVLVNNAGLASGLSHIQDGDIEDWEKMIDTNIKGLLYVTRVISPGMVARGSGHIVNIGSIAGKEVYESGNVYCATKHAVDALNKGMRTDLAEHHIRVTAINPGAVETEFSVVRFHGDRQKADKVYEGFTPLYEQDIAEAILFAVTRPPHVNINDMLIMPTAQASTSKTVKKL